MSLALLSLVTASAGNGTKKLYADDVFSAQTYVGTRADRTIVNGVDLAGFGGAVWSKLRDTPTAGSPNHSIYPLRKDLTYGDSFLEPNTTASEGGGFGATAPSSYVTPLENGYGLSTDTASAHVNYELLRYMSWTFRKAKKFFDVIEYVGGTGETFAHSLGAMPGMVAVKAKSAAGNWIVQHRSLYGTGSYLVLNSTAAAVTVGLTPPPVGMDANNLYLNYEWPGTGLNDLNIPGVTYVAFIWGHDTSAEGLIQCDTFTTDASGNALVTLGFEPQALMYKRSNGTGDWEMLDNLRGMPYTAAKSVYLRANTTGVEATAATRPFPTPDGFRIQGLTASATYVFMAIRRPNKPPASGLDVFRPLARTGTGSAAPVSPGIVTDLVLARRRNSSTDGIFKWWDRLRGKDMNLSNTTTAAQVSTTTSITDFGFADGFRVGTTAPNTAFPYILYCLRRYPGVFDILLFKGEQYNDTQGSLLSAVPHQLGVKPELAITKAVSTTGDWQVSFPEHGLYLNQAAAEVPLLGIQGYADASYISKFGLAVNAMPNAAGQYYVSYLFASMPGIAKVGQFTGNGSSQAIDCAFSAGARFVLIKRVTGGTGDWLVFDTARGIDTADATLALNSSTAEISADSVDIAPSGFVVQQNVTTNLNNLGDTYVYFAIA